MGGFVFLLLLLCTVCLGGPNDAKGTTVTRGGGGKSSDGGKGDKATASPITTVNTCSYTVYLHDQWGDGWSGNTFSCSSTTNGRKTALTFSDGSGTDGSTFVTVLEGFSETYTLTGTDGSTISCQFSPDGKWPTENTFQILTPGDYPVVVLSGQGTITAATYSFTVSCCCSPPQVNQPTLDTNPTDAFHRVLSWTKKNGTDLYRVFVQQGDGDFESFGDATSANLADTIVSLPIYMQPGVTYSYSIAGVNYQGVGSLSPATATVSTPSGFGFCNLEIELLSNWGDGWAGPGYLDLYVDGNKALHLTGSGFSSKFYLTVPSTTSVFAGFLAGDFPADCEYFIRSVSTSEVLAHQGGTGATPTDQLLRLQDCRLATPVQAVEQKLLIHGEHKRHAHHSSQLHRKRVSLEENKEHLHPTVPQFDHLSDPMYALDAVTASKLSHRELMHYYRGQVWVNKNIPADLGFFPGRLGHRDEYIQAYEAQMDPKRKHHLQALSCEFDLAMFDWFQDGWQGSFIDLFLISPSRYSSSFAASGATLPTPTYNPTPRTLSGHPVFANATRVARFNGPNVSRTDFYFSVSAGVWCIFVFSAGNDPNPTDAAYQSVYILPTGQFVYPAVVQSPDNLQYGPLAGITQYLASCGCVGIATGTCAAMNRFECQTTFNAPICANCFPGYSTRTTPTANPQATSDQPNCYDNDECLTPSLQNPSCSPNAICTNLPGTYNCTCNTGFIGDGYNCVAVVQPPSCPTTRLRKEWSDMSGDERNNYVVCLRQLQASGQLAQFVAKHDQYKETTHGTAAFLVWHRAFLTEYETALRAQGGNCSCVALPYWDWSWCQDTTCLTNNIWTNNQTNGKWWGFGAKTAPSSPCWPTSHPYSAFTVASTGACVTRGTNILPSSSSPLPTSGSLFSGLANARTNYANMRSLIEGFHNNVHIYVGGTMLVVNWSPSDPIFFSHHAMVDQIFAAWEACMRWDATITGGWGQWQTSFNNNPTQFWESSAPVAFGDTMLGYNIRYGQGFDLASFNVQYSRSWITRAFSSVNSQWCNINTLTGGTFLQPVSAQEMALHLMNENRFQLEHNDIPVYTTHHHLLADRGNAVTVISGMRRGPRVKGGLPDFLDSNTRSNQRASHEAWKTAFINSNRDVVNATTAALSVDCAFATARTGAGNLITQNMINMMNLQEECAAGFCTDPCWKITKGARKQSKQAVNNRNEVISTEDLVLADGPAQ